MPCVREFSGFGVHQLAPGPMSHDKELSRGVPSAAETSGYRGITKSTRGYGSVDTDESYWELLWYLSVSPPVIRLQWGNSNLWLCKLDPAWLLSFCSVLHKTDCTASKSGWSQEQHNSVYIALHTSKYGACKHRAAPVSLHNLQLKPYAHR